MLTAGWARVPRMAGKAYKPEASKMGAGHAGEVLQCSSPQAPLFIVEPLGRLPRLPDRVRVPSALAGDLGAPPLCARGVSGALTRIGGECYTEMLYLASEPPQFKQGSQGPCNCGGKVGAGGVMKSHHTVAAIGQRWQGPIRTLGKLGRCFARESPDHQAATGVVDNPPHHCATVPAAVGKLPAGGLAAQQVCGDPMVHRACTAVPSHGPPLPAVDRAQQPDPPEPHPMGAARLGACRRGGWQIQGACTSRVGRQSCLVGRRAV